VKTINDRFYALGTTIEGGFRADQVLAEKLCEKIRLRIAEFENHFSRFLPTSELSYLNANPNREITVSPQMIEIMLAARKIWSLTDGLVDPTIGQSLIAAGYDVSFELLNNSDGQPAPARVVRRTLRDVKIDEKLNTVKIPEGTTLDFGGIGKGYILDQLINYIEPLTQDYWLSLGGDLVVSGRDGTNQHWPIGVQNPQALDQDIAELKLPSDRWAVATSGITHRRGVKAGVNWHHLINPRTGQPAMNDVLSVTVVAKSALLADAFAKTILFQGSKDGIEWANRQKDLEALVITDTQEFVFSDNMKKYLKFL